MGDRILCRATVNLPRARRDALVLVDPDDPDIASLIAADLLIREAPAAPWSLPAVLPGPLALPAPGAGDPSPTRPAGEEEAETAP